jgi:hypothetical protein
MTVETELLNLMFGQLWFLPLLVIALLCIIIVKVEKYAVMIVIPALIVLEGLYFQHNSATGSMIWAMISSLLLMFFVAAMSILEAKHKS